jgi:hypothetical protein
MAKYPEKSQVEVFKMVYRTLSRTQRKLHKYYHSDRFLRYQLSISANLPQLERSFKEKAAQTTQESAQRIAALLSSDTGSSGSQRGYSAEYEINEINYGLGSRFEGDTRKRFLSKGKGNRNSWKGPRKRGCWVCEKDHFAREHHSKEEISAALQKMKSERVFVSAESVSDDFPFEIDSTDTTDTEDQINFSLVTKTNDLVYTYGTFRQHYGLELQNMNLALSMGEEGEFSGLIIDTAANMRSAMSIRQYRAYCFPFGVPMKVGKTNRSIKESADMYVLLVSRSCPFRFRNLG